MFLFRNTCARQMAKIMRKGINHLQIGRDRPTDEGCFRLLPFLPSNGLGKLQASHNNGTAISVNNHTAHCRGLPEVHGTSA